MEVAQAQYDVLMLRPRPQAIAEAKSRIDVAQTAVDTAKRAESAYNPRSIAGVLNSLSCQLGQTLPVGTSVGEIVDSRQLCAVVWLSVADAKRVTTGQTAVISSCDAARQADSEIDGKVKNIGKMADPQTGNLPVRIVADNLGGKLTLGQAVSATIVIRSEKVLAVPLEAIHDPGEGTIITVVRDGKTVILHDLKLGLKDDHWVEVGGTNLKPDELVVVEGGYNLPEGTEVAVEKEDEAKPAAAEKEPADTKSPAEKPAGKTAESEK